MHPASKLDLPAGDREQRRVLLVTLGASPAHLLRVELRGHVQRHIRGRAKDLLEAARPHVVQLNHAFVAGPAHRPTRPAAGQLCKQRRALGLDALGLEQSLDLTGGNRMIEHALAARDDRGQDDERVKAGGGQDDDTVWMRLLERLQQHALILVAQAADVGDQRDAAGCYGRLQIQERLQGQLVELGRLVGQQANFIDRERLDAVVFPVVGVT
ncbi:MAG: hypothetical protein E6I96_09735 [Chloroflexi bacterium]|nr:MAG: hypothetical protein E6I96_09735 [Chloroflexota bacterium]